jgi:hypothetical protein
MFNIDEDHKPAVLKKEPVTLLHFQRADGANNLGVTWYHPSPFYGGKFLQNIAFFAITAPYFHIYGGKYDFVAL